MRTSRRSPSCRKSRAPPPLRGLGGATGVGEDHDRMREASDVKHVLTASVALVVVAGVAGGCSTSGGNGSDPLRVGGVRGRRTVGHARVAGARFAGLHRAYGAADAHEGVTVNVPEPVAPLVQARRRPLALSAYRAGSGCRSRPSLVTRAHQSSVSIIAAARFA